jgi:hypothetical protein
MTKFYLCFIFCLLLNLCIAQNHREAYGKNQDFVEGAFKTLFAQMPELKAEIRQRAADQVSRINNYSELSSNVKQRLFSRSIYWLTRIAMLKLADTAKILPPDLLDIHTGIVKIASQQNEVNIVPNFGVPYIPDIDVVYLAYLKYFQTYLVYRENTPIPELVWGIFARETRFMWINGDNGQSVGLCQLHRETARWLLKDKKTSTLFSGLIYFDRPGFLGKHHFYSKEKMVEFMFRFLIFVKDYRQDNELLAITAYNGLNKPREYVRTVQRNTSMYLLHKEISKYLTVGDTNWVSEKIVKTLRPKLRKVYLDNLRELEQMEAVSHSLIASFRDETLTRTKLSFNQTSDIQLINVIPSFGSILVPKISVGIPYIIKRADIVLFAYFRENMDTAVFYHNSVVSKKLKIKPNPDKMFTDTNFIWLYYFAFDPKSGKRKKQIITNSLQYKQISKITNVYCSKISGKVYINTDFPVYYYISPYKKSNVPPCFVQAATAGNFAQIFSNN